MGKLKALYLNLRIQHKMFLIIVVVMSAVGLFGLMAMEYSYGIYNKVIYSESAKSLSMSSISIENELKQFDRLSYRVATDPGIQSNLRAIKAAGTDYDRYVMFTKIRDRIVSFGIIDNNVLSVQIYDAFGKEYAVGWKGITTETRKIDENIKLTRERAGGLTWITPDGADSALTAAREIREFEGLSLDHLGTVAVRIDITRLLSSYTSSFEDASKRFYLLNGDQPVYPDTLPLPKDELQPLLSGMQGYKVMDIDGKPSFVTYVPSSSLGWTYVTVIPFDNIFHSIVSTRQIVIVIYSFMFLLAVLIAFGFARSITDPIERLNAKMKRVQLGKFDYADDLDERPLPMDEAGQLHRNFRIMVERIDSLIQDNYVKQLAIKETEFKALTAQINPHFLYNTLESINWMSKMNGQPDISRMVESLGYLLRSSISLKQPLIPLSEELEIVRHYMTIQAIRFEERLDFQIDIPEELQKALIPKLSLQPIAENAIQYGLEQMIDTCTIRMTAETKDGLLEITVTDNGPGIPSAALKQMQAGEWKRKGTGIGLPNIEERIKILFGEAYGLRLESDGYSGTRVTITVPLEAEEV